MLTTWPLPCSRSSGRNTRLLRATLSRLRSMTRCHASIGSDSGAPIASTPTLFTTMSTRPNRSRQRSRSCFQVACSATLTAHGDRLAAGADRPSPRSPRRGPRRGRSRRRVRRGRRATTAVARPMPLPAPVRTATAPSRSNGIVMRSLPPSCARTRAALRGRPRGRTRRCRRRRTAARSRRPGRRRSRTRRPLRAGRPAG